MRTRTGDYSRLFKKCVLVSSAAIAKAAVSPLISLISLVQVNPIPLNQAYFTSSGEFCPVFCVLSILNHLKKVV